MNDVDLILSIPNTSQPNPDRAKMLLALKQNEELMQELAGNKLLLNEFSRKLMVQAAKAAYQAM
ncbi:hypothetical protein [Spirulina sp. 06S082]|uniref:hypothetical protein n=1 Tax=Spirulina sp. 06S082 TaxID=3110248 RepID=UPI002B205757|nr:hypothetical protein [Spirulina sp. 06S082]MEA5469344.1 hypothetical protein [Spirulina sp. 06S082]